jgi:hypothetical protein
MTPRSPKVRPSPEAIRAGIAEKLRIKKPLRVPYDAVLDPQLAEEVRVARETFQLAKIKMDVQATNPDRIDEYENARKALDALLEKAKPTVLRLWFENIGMVQWEKLMRDHGISDEEKAELRKGGVENIPSWSPKKFPKVAIAACCVVYHPELDADVEPGTLERLWSVSDVEAMWDTPQWSTGELNEMFNTCIAANQNAPRIDLGKG